METTKNLNEYYRQGKFEKLAETEGQHKKLPEKSHLWIAIVLSVIEGGAAFYVLLESGILLAILGSVFPIALLWAIANYSADRIELPKTAEEIIRRYQKNDNN